jgi:hypothetical protein
MSDDKPKPVDDLKEGLGLLFRAAKGVVEKLPTDKLEDVAKDAVKEVTRAFESLGTELEKVVGGHHARDVSRPADPAQPQPTAEKKEEEESSDAPPKDPPKYDDGYAPDPPKGPRVG